MEPEADLVRRIEARLTNLGREPWLPDLTAELAETGWSALGETMGLTRKQYGTARALSVDPAGPLNVITHIALPTHVPGSPGSLPIEILPEEVAEQFREKGAEFYGKKEIFDSTILGCVNDAISILSKVPTVIETVARLVRSLHLLRPRDDRTDISFSEPEIPFSAFVSVPLERAPNDALRVAEAMLHESMHLQLTLVDRLTPLSNPSEGIYFSPWRGDRRPAEGILHALYVFSVIREVLGEILEQGDLPAGVRDYVKRRRKDISKQILSVRSFGDSAPLTPRGAGFVRGLIARK